MDIITDITNGKPYSVGYAEIFRLDKMARAADVSEQKISAAGFISEFVKRLKKSAFQCL